MADSHEDDPFSSIPATFWWCVVTLTTVGYGDAYPLTAYGKLAAAFTMIASVVITAYFSLFQLLEPISPSGG